MSEKRKKITLTIQQKLEIIERFEKGESALFLSKYYGIGVQTVRDINKNKINLENFARNSGAGPCKRRTLKKPVYEDLDIALLQWFNQKRLEGMPISGPTCAQKAKVFFEELGFRGDFSASSGWLTRFKKRHGICELSVQEDPLTVDPIIDTSTFQIEFKKIIEDGNYQVDQIYNADESGLYWKRLPTRTLDLTRESPTPELLKSSRERVTVMCCGNASGEHKLKLLLIGKAKKPRSSKGTEASNLPVHYYSQKGAWMDREIFEHWFKNRFVPEVRCFLEKKGLQQKAILLIDNAPTHSCESTLKSEDGLITVKFLPRNIASAIQPMNQGVIASMKQHYRTALLGIHSNEDENLIAYCKKMTILDAIYGAATAWCNVKPMTLVRSWNNLLVNVQDHVSDSNKESDDTSDMLQLMKNLKGFDEVDIENLNEWLLSDSNEQGFQYMSDAAIAAATPIPNADEENEDEITFDRISHSKALQSVEDLLEYMNQWNFNYDDTIVLKKLRSDLKSRLNDSETQTKITNYFTKPISV